MLLQQVKILEVNTESFRFAGSILGSMFCLRRFQSRLGVGTRSSSENENEKTMRRRKNCLGMDFTAGFIKSIV